MTHKRAVNNFSAKNWKCGKLVDKKAQGGRYDSHRW